MEAVTYSKARNNLKKIMDSVCDNIETFIITRKNNRNVVMISLEEYNSITETLHLLSTPENTKRLLRENCLPRYLLHTGTKQADSPMPNTEVKEKFINMNT